MEVIFHEKQEGSLCAQHCLNALLQGPYFSPVELASLAQQMDDEERKRMAESGVDSDDYRKFLEQPSGNMDDSGYFSVQVISSALEVWGLELVPYSSSEQVALMAQKCPTDMQAYICNYRDHWFTIRRLGNQWFNLNSMLTGPELLSNTYLAMFLAQLQQEGYSIFVVNGVLPESDADNLLRVCPAVQTVKPQLLRPPKNAPSNSTSVELLETGVFSGVGNVLGSESSSESKVLSESSKDVINRQCIESSNKSVNPLLSEEEEDDLQRAIMASKAEAGELVGDIQPSVLLELGGAEDDKQLREALRLSLEVQNESLQSVIRSRVETPDEEGDEELQKALQMSLECCTDVNRSKEMNMEEIRQRRLAFLENAGSNSGPSSTSSTSTPTITQSSSQLNDPNT